MAAMLVSRDASTRAAAIGIGRAWGDAGREHYRTILWKSWQRQELNLDRALRQASTTVGRFTVGHRNWQALGRDAMQAVTNDLGDSRTRVAVLDERFSAAHQARAEIDRVVQPALLSVALLNDLATGMDELEKEIAYTEGKTASAPVGVRKRLSQSIDGRAVLAAEKALLAMRHSRDAHTEAALHNTEQHWAPRPARQFAALLNTRRRVLGLDPLRLEPHLWKACAMHATEMKQLGYFNHESPREEHRTPGLRARVAKFTGSLEGENLFHSESPQTAEKVFRSWWLSDAHRDVLFASRPNTMGLDTGGGTHWAMMTGLVKETQSGGS